ncbi:MAG TPA: hypothetical protein VMN04_07430 [Thermoanaerobaculia bacterium]|nr:hypothetical protein [Thermoanaerobaculia bacterium]
MWENLGNQIGDAVLRLGEAFLAVVPAFVVLLGAFAVGAAVGFVLRLVLVPAFRLLRIGDGSAPLLRAAGLKAPPAAIASAVSFWAAVVVALAVGIGALEPGGLKTALEEVVAFLPRLLTAALVTLVGIGLAALARRSVLLTAVNAGLPWPRAGARLVHAGVLAFFAAMALEHLGVGQSVLVAAFSIVTGGFVLAAALAFGLGARDLARGYLERRVRVEEETNGIRHV